MIKHFMPHGMCFAWQQNVLLLHVVSDALIAIAYVAIAITLVYVAWRRRELPFRWLFVMFGAFIFSCALTHLLSMWTIWHADYWFDGCIKAFTALVSALTAIVLVRLVPKVLSLRSPQDRERIEALAFLDALTGLPNRVLLHDRISQTIHAARRRGEHFAVLFLDLDSFKEINDGFGHAAGDSVLKVVAARLKHEVRLSDTVARLGGDEFVIVGAAVANLRDASIFGQRVLHSLSQPISDGKTMHQISASIGVSFFPAGGTDGDALLEQADDALYAAKRSGKNQMRFATPSKSTPASEAESA